MCKRETYLSSLHYLARISDDECALGLLSYGPWGDDRGLQPLASLQHLLQLHRRLRLRLLLLLLLLRRVGQLHLISRRLSGTRFTGCAGCVRQLERVYRLCRGYLCSRRRASTGAVRRSDLGRLLLLLLGCRRVDVLSRVEHVQLAVRHLDQLLPGHEAPDL